MVVEDEQSLLPLRNSSPQLQLLLSHPHGMGASQLSLPPHHSWRVYFRRFLSLRRRLSSRRASLTPAFLHQKRRLHLHEERTKAFPGLNHNHLFLAHKPLRKMSAAERKEMPIFGLGNFSSAMYRVVHSGRSLDITNCVLFFRSIFTYVVCRIINPLRTTV